MRPGWDPRSERDACGIGFVADASGRSGRRVVDAGLEALSRLEHRGAAAADGVTGDGAGLLAPVPRALLAGELGLSPSERGAAGLGVAMLFARGTGVRRLPGIVADACAAEGIEVAAWRGVPVDAAALGPAAATSMPEIRQAILRGCFADGMRERRAEHRARRRIERAARRERLDVYVASLGFRTVTYKGLVRAGRLADLYPDLADERFTGWFTVFHQRYSTNTMPAWERAQPFRLLCHNGEINTLSGNEARMRAREGSFGCGDDEGEELLRPALDELGSDSSMLDEAVQLFASEGDAAWDVERAIAALVPPAWEAGGEPDGARLAFHRWHEARIEPWDGPAGIVFSDGGVVGAALDRNGLRPLRWSAADEGLVVCASETGVVDLEGPIRRGRIGPGEMLVVDPARGGLQEDPLARLAGDRPYGTWVAAERTGPPALRSDEPRVDLLRLQVAHGLTREDISLAIRPMATTGHEPTFSMGDDTPIPPLATRPRPLTSFLRQHFAQVTNPAIDHLREGWVMSSKTFLGARPPALMEGPAGEPIAEVDAFLLEGRPEGRVLDATWSARDGPGGMEAALARIVDEAIVAVASGAAPLLILHHGEVGPDRAPIPSVLAVGAVHAALVAVGQRLRTSLAVVADDVWGSHDAACLLSVGADIICPRLALATVDALCAEGRLPDVGAAPPGVFAGGGAPAPPPPTPRRSRTACARRSPGWGSPSSSPTGERERWTRWGSARR
jgi:glutamate synthase domain-containing protein 1